MNSWVFTLLLVFSVCRVVENLQFFDFDIDEISDALSSIIYSDENVEKAEDEDVTVPTVEDTNDPAESNNVSVKNNLKVVCNNCKLEVQCHNCSKDISSTINETTSVTTTSTDKSVTNISNAVTTTTEPSLSNETVIAVITNSAAQKNKEMEVEKHSNVN